MGYNLTDLKESIKLNYDPLDPSCTNMLRPDPREPSSALRPDPRDPSSSLALHPALHDIYQKCQTHLLAGDGPLPYTHRHYIAIMACSRYGCDRLVGRERAAYLQAGGEPSWLEGVHRAPLQLRRLAEINKILAHRPWCLNQSHIKDLTVGDGSWSLAELVQAIVILVHFHSGSSFVLGCADGSKDPKQGTSVVRGGGGAVVARKSLSKPNFVSREKTESRSQSDENRSKRRYCAHRRGRTLSETEIRKENVLDQLELVYTLERREMNPSYLPFIQDPEYQYIDFKETDNPTLKVHDFSWDDHGFSIMSSFYGDMSLLLDDKFRVAKNMTYNFFGSKKAVDTSTFRRSIWNYVQCLFGVHHDDFDYKEIGRALDSNLKEFVKVSACNPGTITDQAVHKIMLDSKLSEKIHVKILIMEAKTQALLLYALRAIMEHMA